MRVSAGRRLKRGGYEVWEVGVGRGPERNVGDRATWLNSVPGQEAQGEPELGGKRYVSLGLRLSCLWAAR